MNKMIKIVEPQESDSTDCHLQQLGMGSLICRAAKQTGQENATNEVTPGICFSCDVGKIFRDVGCDAASPKLTVISNRHFGPTVNLRGIFCQIRRRDTSLEYCETCTLATAESTRQIVTTTRGLLQSVGFHSAYQDIEKAREAIRDGEFDRAITHSIACLESTCRVIHDELGAPLPNSKDLTSLWKSTRKLLALDQSIAEKTMETFLNSLHGVIVNIGTVRNALSDAHGKGKVSPEVSEAMAELALNGSATAATFIVRHFKHQTADGEQ